MTASQSAVAAVLPTSIVIGRYTTADEVDPGVSRSRACSPCRSRLDWRSVWRSMPGPLWPGGFGRGGRVADCSGLENRQGVTTLGGSNPPPSALFLRRFASHCGLFQPAASIPLCVSRFRLEDRTRSLPAFIGRTCRVSPPLAGALLIPGQKTARSCEIDFRSNRIVLSVAASTFEFHRN